MHGNALRYISFLLTMVIFTLLTNDFALMPQKATGGSAGYDLRASLPETHILTKGSHAIIPTGVSTKFGNDVVGLLCSRSGMAAKHGVFVLNAPGVIDSDYEDEVKVILMNLGSKDFVIEPYQRIAQLVFAKLSDSPDVVTALKPRQGGFGSTGQQ
jgi:dUTP pyrophosphatase